MSCEEFFLTFPAFVAARKHSAPKPKKKVLAKAASERKHAMNRSARLLFREQRSLHSCLFLAALTLICLLPFCGKAFHIDDTLFIRAAEQIANHPLDPYGFPIVWYSTSMPMSEVTQNPPGASYYIAAIGQLADWSEVTMHLAFLLPALTVILGTYYLARRFTSNPRLAAAATLLTPGFLVSSTDVMCDTMMVAAWIVAAILWLEGLDREKPALLGLSALVIAACALTKYFGIALVPLLLAYTIVRSRRVGTWILFLLIPILILVGYQDWTRMLYGKGLLLQAAEYARQARATATPRIAKAVIGFTFIGGCTLPALTFIPVLWSRWKILLGAIMAGIVGLCCAVGWISLPTPQLVHDWKVALQLSLFVVGGIFVLALALSDLRKRRDADSVFLVLWVLGVFVFTIFINWTINARSALPLIPATGILLARRADSMDVSATRARLMKLIAPLAVAGLISIWVTWADTSLANSARLAAQYVRSQTTTDATNLSFEGHWGFQYYMEQLGFQALDFNSYQVRAGNLVVLPENNTNVRLIPSQFVGSQRLFAINMNTGVTTMSTPMGAGFYADVAGPMPYVFGSVPAERYMIVRLIGSGSLQ